MFRRHLLASTPFLYFAGTYAGQATITTGLPGWNPNTSSPPLQINPGPWVFFSPEEAAAVEAIADRLIPPDPETPGGKDAGCGVFIDHQLAGDYGMAATFYMQAPFHVGSVSQGPQSPDTPRAVYRQGLSALSEYCRSAFLGKDFVDLNAGQRDELLSGLESGKIKLVGFDGAAFFKLVLKNVMEGFLADPIYGGNRNMAGWKMIGFPGTRYDYRDWIDRHNEPYPFPPVSIGGRAV